MSNFRWIFLSVCVGLMTSCATTQQSAPIEDRATGVRPASLYEGKPGYHVVKPGETVMQLSRNTGYKPADIIAWNNLAKPNELKVGQVLRIAPPGNDSVATTATVTTTNAAADAQSGAASSRSVEMTPLFPAGSTVAPANAANAANTQSAPQAAVMNKAGPRGDKQPYSENTLTAMQQQPDYGAPLAAASSAAPSAQTAAKTTALQATAPQTASSKMATQQIASQQVATPQTAGNASLATWKWPADGRQLSGFVENQSKGIDIAGTMGQPVRVAADGKVTHVGPLRGYGNMVIVKHNESLNTVYAHNKTILVKEGDVVKQGQQIAEMGNSDSDMVKLRFEVRQHGKPVDPSKFLPPR